jgi:hypothetical protein
MKQPDRGTVIKIPYSIVQDVDRWLQTEQYSHDDYYWHKATDLVGMVLHTTDSALATMIVLKFINVKELV